VNFQFPIGTKGEGVPGSVTFYDGGVKITDGIHGPFKYVDGSDQKQASASVKISP
jgi:hypothetical protein